MQNELYNFVKESLSRGIARVEIQNKLSQAGWRLEEIKSALDSFFDSDFPIPIPRRTPYIAAREAFMYLLTFLTLYISAFSFGTLLFQFINRVFPDPLRQYESSLSVIRSATSALIIAFPIFMLMSWLLLKTLEANPNKRGSKIRKWLTYITLFMAAGVIMGDLITLVRTFLEGELTLRFVLKVFSVLTISGTIFSYYLWNMKKEEQEK